jgi:hypothetical protein
MLNKTSLWKWRAIVLIAGALLFAGLYSYFFGVHLFGSYDKAVIGISTGIIVLITQVGDPAIFRYGDEDNE